MLLRPASAAVPDRNPLTRTVKLYPDIAMAMLRQRLAAPGRLWLLLRHIDAAGRGWIDVEDARQQITKKGSPLRAVGWRQMRKLLASGDGLFWQRGGRRIWLRSPLKVAALLGIKRLDYQPIGLPVSELLKSIGQVRAHFYATFHSGRNPDETKGGRAAPIARATLRELCQTSRRTQRSYEQRAGVQRRRNFAIGKPLTKADHQNQAWQRGRALFQFSDRNSDCTGRPGATFTAWQLPNSYSGPHKKQPKGRQKRMNRQLADLFMEGMTGNGERNDQTVFDGKQSFFDSAVGATTAYNRRPDRDLYWPRRTARTRVGFRQSGLWDWLPARDGITQRHGERQFKTISRGTK